MTHVLIVHGSLRRPSTKRWVGALRSFLAQRDIQTSAFWWSGIPWGRTVRRASEHLSDVLAAQRDGPMVIVAKSVGADIVNLARESVEVDGVVQIAPAFVVSKQIVRPQKVRTVVLENDAFLRSWMRLRVVHDIPSEAFQVLNQTGRRRRIGHHDLSLNIEAEIADQGVYNLYEFYAGLIDELAAM